MDNHPIPQDITGFQFKLIGNMTVKQFIYLAIGGVLAWVFFFMLPLPGFLKWFLAAVSISIGAMFALVPIDGRPMDLMLANFIKALISPTQFVYEKKGGNIDEHKPYQASKSNTPQQPNQTIISPQQANNTPPSPAQNTLQQVQIPQVVVPEPTPPPPITIPTPQPPPPPMPISMPSPVTATFELGQDEPKKTQQADYNSNIIEDENKKLKEELENLKKELEAAKSAPPPPPQITVPIPQVAPTTNLEKDLTQAQREKEALQKQILEMQAKTQTTTQTFTPSAATPQKQTEKVRQIPKGMEKGVGLPSAPEDPNLITGIIKDARGNPISNILVEIKDSDSNPVRAFKTNILGKFASATALSNGKYVLTFEDSAEKHKFDAVEIELIGTPVMPLEIISVDPREELRRELFN